jgi:hypothetical protein
VSRNAVVCLVAIVASLTFAAAGLREMLRLGLLT